VPRTAAAHEGDAPAARDASRARVHLPRMPDSMPDTSRHAMIVARAPARLDLGGGWTDVPPYTDEEGGCVCNVAITRHATVRLSRRDDPAPRPLDAPGRRDTDARLATAALRRDGAHDALRAEIVSDFPVSAGLGGSSAAGVALAAALAAWRGTLAPNVAPDHAQRDALAEWSRAVEVEDAGIAGGRQDHYAAAHGGALRLDFGAAAGGRPASARRLHLPPATLADLARRAVVVYTGESRISGDTIVAVLDAYRARERRVVDALARMRALAGTMADALERGDLDALGALLAEHWAHQRALHPRIPTPRIDAVLDRATRAGALGGKALGASGGGCVLALAADGREAAVREAVAPFGEVLTFAVDTAGVVVEAS
jgi:D-glycero-alpha-D-manno-heptose-7-phosphate kinase